jgi:Uma2 family endonuclease
LLVNGDRMTQKEFHRRYEAYPDGVKFELVGGIVYMASPLRWTHGSYHVHLAVAFGLYGGYTPGVEAGDNATTILGEESEPQPDLALRIVQECGGQSVLNAGQYVEGPPELIAEIAHSSRAMDMHQKKEDYLKAGVLEYLVLCVEEGELHWFHFPSGKPIKLNRQGVYRSRVFPGLWIDRRALLEGDSPRLAEVVRVGTASREHAAFVKHLRAARRKQGR